MRRGITKTILVLPVLLAATGCELMLLLRPPSRSERHPVDFTEALAFAERAEAAYLKPSEIEARFAPARVVVRDLPQSKVRFFVVFDDQAKTQAIAVRGTENLENVRVDAEYTPEPDPALGIHLHSGFARAGEELHEAILPVLDKTYATTLAGHSLGGALAAILGMYLEADGFRVTRIVTFGQPKVTNVAGARRFAELPITRFVNGTDPVPDVPPMLYALDPEWRYTHFGTEVILGTDKRYIVVEEHQVLATGLVSFWANLGSHEVPDHRMVAYVESLRAKLVGAEEIPFEKRDLL